MEGVGDEVCNRDAVLIADDASAGLDITAGGFSTVDGQNVTACVGVDFKTLALEGARVTLSSTPKACSTGCEPPFCTGKALAHIFAATLEAPSTWRHIGSASLIARAETYTVHVPTDLVYSLIVVCRNANSPQKDDVAVGSITPTCK